MIEQIKSFFHTILGHAATEAKFWLFIMIITILQVVNVERQLDLNNCPSISTGHAAEDSVSSLSPSLSIDSGFSSIREKPQQTQMFGESSEMDIPESRTEFNEDMGAAELPSVNRLKALFNAGKGDDSASVKRVSRNLTISMLPSFS